MIYNDGYATDDELRFVRCPRCGNEEYSENSRFCRICGFQTFNECEGYYDNEIGEHVSHRNARYCEFCGQPTILFQENLLKPYTEVQGAQELDDDEYLPFDTDDVPF